MSEVQQTTSQAADLESVAIERARALARAIGESAAYRAFEETHEGLMADQALRQRLQAHQAERQAVELAKGWGGADRAREAAVEAEWRSLSAHPVLHAYLQAEEELTALLREVVGVLDAGLGIDYGATCTPPSSCCG